MGPLSKLGSFQEQMSANTKRQMRTRGCLFIYLFTFYFLQLHQSIMSVILALFDILICKFVIAIDSDYQPIQDNIISVETFTCVALFFFPFFFPVGNNRNQTHTAQF